MAEVTPRWRQARSGYEDRALYRSRGVAGERERAAYRAELITGRDRFLIAYLPVAEDGLTCLEFVGAFSIALRPGVDRRDSLRPRYIITGAWGGAQ